MKKIFSTLIIILILTGLNAGDEDKFLKKEILFTKTEIENSEKRDSKDFEKLNFLSINRKNHRRRIRILKVNFEKQNLKDPVICFPQARMLYRVYTKDDFLFQNFSQEYKLLDIQSYSSKPDIIDLEKIPEVIYIEVIGKSMPFFDFHQINIGEKEEIYRYAQERNSFKLIIDQIFFYQGVSLLLFGLPSIIIFFLYRDSRKNITVIIFGLMATISGFIHLKLSAFSAYQNPLTYFDFSTIFIGFILISILLFLFIKEFFKLPTKRFVTYIAILILFQGFIYFVFPYKIAYQVVFFIFNFILLGEVYYQVLIKRRFSAIGKFVVLFSFTCHSLLAILDLIFNLESLHMIFTPFGMGINLIAFSLFYLLIENYISIRNEKKAYELKLSNLEKKNLEAELDSLKKQIDPHFLFNSLGTLVSLIDYSQETAKGFVEELSSVYRYILQIQKKNLITIKEELKFVESYLFLMKQRFHGNLNIEINVDTVIQNKLVIPAAVQILVENAIKHNKVSNKYPLTIEIKNINNDSISVSNNLQPVDIVNSEKIGLENLNKRLEFYSDKKIQIKKNKDYFKVSIPLINEIS